jgi:hypothetical protein
MRIGAVICLSFARVPTTRSGCHLGEQIIPPVRDAVNPCMRRRSDT